MSSPETTQYTFIQVWGGKVFDIYNPTTEMIDIENIAHALSLLCRFGGHCNEFYSVADHSIRCSEYAPNEYKLEALLHDASEAYLVDMPRPLKHALKDYRNLEKKFEGVIQEKFDLPRGMSVVVKDIDNKMLITEKRDIMSPMDRPWEGDWPDPFEDKIIPRKDPKKVEKLFLDYYYRYNW